MDWVPVPSDPKESVKQVLCLSSPKANCSSQGNENKARAEISHEVKARPRLRSYSVPKAVSLRSSAASPSRRSYAFGSTMSPSRDDKDSPKRAPLRSITNRVPDRVRTWRTVPKVGLSTPASVSRTTFRMSLPETEEGDRCLALEKVLHYSGGSALLLEGGGLALYASGSTLVVTEVESEGTSERKTSGAGLWGLFPTVNKERSHGRQAFLFGHSQPVVHLRVSVSNKFLISAEKDSKALLIVWNIFASGAKKVAAFRPFDGGIRCIALNENDSLLCVVGWDKCRRLLLIIFDLHALLRDKIGITPPSPTKSPVIIAKQVSDFDVADIIFSPISEDSLVSCGRENVRFWRIKKGHLPGRPVSLNEYARGYDFTCIRYYQPEQIVSSTTPPANMASASVFVASNKGVLLRVDCDKEQVLCAYQLHNAGIASFVLLRGFAVTGGADSIFRIWPMDFTDFLLEAYHESPVTCVEAASDGKTLIIGTASGALGFLNTMNHSYSTILRSHTKSIRACAAKANTQEEFVTLSDDGSIRIWDTLSLEQKYEFNSPTDVPFSAAFHPTQRLLAVGFSSGTLRIFDIATTCQLHERVNDEVSPCTAVLFSPCGSRLFAINVKGGIQIFDPLTNYSLLKSLYAFDTKTAESVRTEMHGMLSDDGLLLACCDNHLSSLCVINTVSMQIIFRVHMASNSPTVPVVRPSAVVSASTLPLQKHPPFIQRDLSELERMQSNFGDVVGLSFCNGGLTNRKFIILACTKYLVSIPLIYQRNNDFDAIPSNDLKQVPPPEILWGDRSFRRIDFGIPKSFSCDSNGISFMLLQTPDVVKPEGESLANAMAIFTIKHKQSMQFNRYPFAISTVQVYRQREGNGSLTAIVPCLSCERVIVPDSSGAINVWISRPDKFAQLIPKSPTEFETPVNSEADGRRLPSDSLPTWTKDEINGLTAQFEEAVNENPHVWSAESESRLIDSQRDAREGAECRESPGNISFESRDNVKSEDSSDFQVTDANPEDSYNYLQSIIAHRAVAVDEALGVEKHEDEHDELLEQDEIMSPLPPTRLKSKSFDSYSKSGYIFSAEMISNRFLLPPQFCPLQRTLLSSDGGAVYLHDLPSSRGVFLVGGGSSITRKVFALSISPDGKTVAALSHIPSRERSKNKVLNSVQITMWNSNEDDLWNFLGSFVLLEASRSVHIDWTSKGDLVFFARLDSLRGEAILKVIHKSHCFDKALFGTSLSKPGIQILLRGDVEHFTVLDRFVDSLFDPQKIFILTRGGGRMHLLRIDLSQLSSTIEWTEFIGKKKKYLVADVSCVSCSVLNPSSSDQYTITPPKSALLLSIDSGGLDTLRATAFRFNDCPCQSKLHLAHLPGPYAFGAPRSLKISSCGTHLIIGQNMSVRVMAITVKGFDDLELQTFSVALTALQKVRFQSDEHYIYNFYRFQ